MMSGEEDLKRRLVEVFELAAKHYNPSLDIANENESDPNYPHSFVTAKSVMGRRMAVHNIEHREPEFTEDFIDYAISEGLTSFFVKPSVVDDASEAPYVGRNLHQMKEDFTSFALDAEQKHELAIITLNNYVNHLDEFRPRMS